MKSPFYPPSSSSTCASGAAVQAIRRTRGSPSSWLIPPGAWQPCELDGSGGEPNGRQRREAEPKRRCSRRRCLGRRLSSGKSALSSPRHQDHEAHADDTGGSRWCPECRRRRVTEVEEDGLVRPRRCTKNKLNPPVNSVRCCDYKGHSGVEDNLPECPRASRPRPPAAKTKMMRRAI